MPGKLILLVTMLHGCSGVTCLPLQPFCIVLWRAAIGRHRWRQPTPECKRFRVHISNASNTLRGAKLHIFGQRCKETTGARQILKSQASDSKAIMRSASTLAEDMALRSQGASARGADDILFED